MRVYVARHGETTWNLAGRYQGRRESALTGLGMQQGLALAAAMTSIEATPRRIIASPLLRCTATAQFSAERLNLPIATDDRLLEIAHGTWEGRLRDEIAADDAARYRTWRERPADVAFEGGETLAQVHARWHAFATDFVADTPTLVVTHDVVVRVAILEAQRRPLADLWNVRVENAAFAIFDVTGNTWTLNEETVTTHLAGVHATTEAQAL
jgi:broad specificity phosphatase PhoE